MAESKSELTTMKCVPCRGGIPPLQPDKIEKMMNIVEDWKLSSGPDRIVKMYKFKDFKQAMAFVNKVANIAEQEGHHPDISISWNKVTLTLWTHAINGLHENDFIMAAKIDEMLEKSKSEK